MTWPGFEYSCNLILSWLCSSTWRLSSWWCFDVSGNRKWCLRWTLFCTQLLFVCCLSGSEEALQFDTFKALKYLLFLQLAGRRESSSTDETTFGFSKQLMGAYAQLRCLGCGSCKWLHSFFVFVNEYLCYVLIILHHAELLNFVWLFFPNYLSMGEIFLWSFQFIGQYFFF